MQLIHIFIALTFFLAVSSAIATDALEAFYEGADSLQDVSAYNSSELCWLKWKRTFGRWKNSKYPTLNGRQKKKILLVHVGKTAGGTVGEFLAKADIDLEQVHFHAVDEAMLQDRDAILLSLRQPVHRLISAFNFQNPHNRKILRPDLIYNDFYETFKNLDEYAQALTDNTKKGMIARMGVGHLELDTCAYLGGVVDTLKLLSSKVFAIDTNTVIEDMNKISARLKWGKRFQDTLHKHEYAHADNLTHISMAGMMKLTGYAEMAGEAPLYRELMHLFHIL